MKNIYGLLGTVMYLVSGGAPCFDLTTHAAISQRSFERYLQDRPGLLSSLGFVAAANDPRAPSPFGIHYFHMGSPFTAPPQRDANRFEARIIGDIDGSVPPNSITGWVMAGSIREDDYPTGPNPQNDDPYGEIVRSLSHFYDPVFNRPLTLKVAGAVGARAPVWATGAADPFGQPNQPDPNRRNHFTIADVREAMFRALTLKANTNSDLPQPSDAAGKAVMRNAYWATTFRALGDVLHLVQDMAQPQHTRNDAHSGSIVPNTGHASIFESYLDARARRLRVFEITSDYLKLTTTIPISLAPLPLFLCDSNGINCGDYPTPVGFTEYSQFFSTSPGSAVGGRGLADYSNTQFFSAGKNLGNADYTSPPNSAAAYTISSVAPRHWDGSPITDGSSTAPVYLFTRGVVIDNQNLSYNASNVPLTSVSIWDEFMQARALSPSFHLTRENYDAQADLLMPRAVAYGVGLLERFFRGGMQISLPDSGAFAVVDHGKQNCKDSCGFGKVSLKLKNSTPTDSMGPGSFFAVAKFRRNACYIPDLSGDPGAPMFAGSSCRSGDEEITVSDPVYQWKLPNGSLAAGEQQPVDFWFANPIPINATDIYLQVVFRGQLGNETDAVVVTTKNISEPNYVAIVNDYDYTYNYVTDTFQSVAPDPQTQTITQIDVKLGNATTPIATLPSLGVRGYAQLAFLTDIGGAGTEKIVVDLNAPGFGPWIALDLPVATFDSPGGTVYERTRNVIKYRGMWSDYRFDLFQGSRYGTESCAPLDTRRVCTSAGLTAITPANAVAWTINFP